MLIDTIVTDMDDTLFDGESRISPETLRVMRLCVARGIRVIPASGRTQRSMEPYMQQLQTGCPYIGSNGAETVSAAGEVLECQNLNVETARAVCRFVKQHGLYAQLYQDDHYYYDADVEPAMRWKQTSGLEGRAVEGLADFLDFPVSKILCIGHPQQVERMIPVIRERFLGQVDITTSKPNFVEVIPPGVSKGGALKRLAKRIGIAPERTLVFGDSMNDLSMLAFTENSVAMGNARPEVKAAARYQCGPNTADGLAAFVGEHVLAGEGIEA